MLTPEQIDAIVETMYPLLDDLNVWITNDIIRRFMERMGRGVDNVLTGTDVWQAEVYQSAGGHLEDLQQELQKFTKKSDDEIRKIFEDAGIQAWAYDNAFYVQNGMESRELALSDRMVQILTDTYQRTNATVQNFTRTTATASQQRLIKSLDDAHFKVMTGAQSYTAAVKEAVDDLAGVQTKVSYPTGHIDTIETAVLRAVRTGVAQGTGNMTMQGMIDRDWDLIRVSAHLGARYGDGGQNPGNHFWWQGKLYSRTGRTPGYLLFKEATGYGTGEGLCGWNCRHSFGPGDPNHNPFRDFDAEENKKAYDLSQKQRSIERNIRKTKVQVMGLRTALEAAEDAALKADLEDSYNRAAARLTRYNKKYNDFCEENNLKKLYDRIRVANWNRSQAAKASAAARKFNKVK